MIKVNAPKETFKTVTYISQPERNVANADQNLVWIHKIRYAMMIVLPALQTVPF